MTAPPSDRKERATDISSLSAKVTNITGLSGVTRSGRVFAPPDLPNQPTNVKGKAKVVVEQDDKTPSLRTRIFQRKVFRRKGMVMARRRCH